MSVRTIVTAGDPVLRERAREVSVSELRSSATQALIDDLIETRRSAGGAGLAAPQVGVAQRIAVVEVDDATIARYPYKPLHPLTVMINPQLEPVGEEMVEINEGCLSVPGLRGVVPRFVEVRARWIDRDGEPHDELKRGLTAGTFQHEVDHLDGILFLDRVADPATFMTWEAFDRWHREAFIARMERLPR